MKIRGVVCVQMMCAMEQRCVGKFLLKKKKREPLFVTFANFCGVNILTKAKFKLPTVYQLTWKFVSI